MRGTEFPKFVYHKTLGSKVVNSKEEQTKLGKDWGETPFPDAAAASEPDGGVEGLEARVQKLEDMFAKLRTRKDIDKLLAEEEEN